MFDLIIKNGTIIDGTKAPRQKGDVGIKGDTITAVGDLQSANCENVIDASGKIVTPGFVDTHNHSDGWLLKLDNQYSKTSQGFTTEIIMLDGISYAPVNDITAKDWMFYLRALDGLRVDEYTGWESIDDYMQLLNGNNVQNAIPHIPYANVRSLCTGFRKEFVDDLQMKLIQAEIRKGMEDGAVGVSTGIDYIVQCYSTTDELAEACSVLGEYGGLYATHVRYKKGPIPSMREAVEIGKRSGAKVHISHLKAHSEENLEELFDFIDNEARNEVDFSFDAYPYQPGSTMLSYLVPYETWDNGPLGALQQLNQPAIRAKFKMALNSQRLPLDKLHIAWVASKENSCFQGKTLQDYVDAVGLPEDEALLNLLIDERLAVLLVFNEGDDKLIHPILQHDLCLMGSDGIFQLDGPIHPRQYGSATKLLGECSHDLNLFSLEDAVYKLTSGPANRFGLTNRGTLKEGYFADLVVFDADTVAERSTYENPHQTSAGIDAVVVNGVPILRDGVPVEGLQRPLPGRALKFNR